METEIVITKGDIIRRVMVTAMIGIVLLVGMATCTYAKTWTINGVTLPLNESGYREGDYIGAGKCWQFASHIYYRIWNRLFYQDAGTDEDMLRNYPHGEARRITAENAELFISYAPVGSVIRLQTTESGPDKTKSASRHSMILLDKTENGCTVYHLWKGIATISTFTWAGFAQQFRYDTDFGYFKYIKYPGVDQLDFIYDEEPMDKELTISSKIYGSTEISEKKR